MAIKIFSIKNKATGKIDRLIKAETKGQVNKHLVSSVEIEVIGAVEAVELMGSGTMIVEDATAKAADEPAAETATETATDEQASLSGESETATA